MSTKAHKSGRLAQLGRKVSAPPAPGSGTPHTPSPLLTQARSAGECAREWEGPRPLLFSGTPIKTGGPYKKNSAKISKQFLDNTSPCIEITTKKGETIIINWQDADLVLPHSWYVNKDGYAQTNIEGKPVLMQRLLLGAVRGVEVDHEDRNKLNNRRGNLRIATKGQNAANRVKSILSKNNFKGVAWNKKSNRWEAWSSKDMIRHFGGSFRTEEEAARAYDVLAVRLHGKFARINFQGPKK